MDDIVPNEESKQNKSTPWTNNLIEFIDGKEVPPKDEAWTFNENDILGNIKDENGDMVITENRDGDLEDMDGKPVN